MKISSGLLRSTIAAAVLAGSVAVAFAADITGAGATFPFPIYSKWAAAYKAQTGTGLNYQSIGSGGGIAQIKASTVTFGATDKPLSIGELAAAGLVQWPMVMGGIVPVVNVPGVKPGEMVLSGKVVVDIYLGKITKWDDPAIKTLNPGLSLPSSAIAVVHRSDGSGTTFNFTNYLARLSPEWMGKVGSDTSVEWPTGIGAKGNEGVSGTVAQTQGSIGYVEYAYAKQNNLTYTRMVNRDGKTVSPTQETFSSAAANAKWDKNQGFYTILVDEPGPTSWPITAATFILMHKSAANGAASKEALKFFAWAYKNGKADAASLDYIPIPDKVVEIIESSWSDIKDSSGTPVWP
ncbi:MAG: phosphate ABC transporter substrate-binding protein PstS [Alphaproteobacteria bacterium]|nr:phosphate ABC transporter substrate-binding protein PstS [Alphaproteobacteria bacterium]